MNKQSFLLIALFSLSFLLTPCLTNPTHFRSLSKSFKTTKSSIEDSQRLLLQDDKEPVNTTVHVGISGGMTSQGNLAFQGTVEEPKKEMNIEHDVEAETDISFGEDGQAEVSITLNGTADMTIEAEARVFDGVDVDLQADIEVEVEVQLEVDIDRKSGEVTLEIEVDVGVEADIEVKAHDDEGNVVESYVTSEIEVRVDVEVEMEVEDREGGQDVNVDVDIKIQADVNITIDLDWNEAEAEVDGNRRLLRGL